MSLVNLYSTTIWHNFSSISAALSTMVLANNAVFGSTKPWVTGIVQQRYPCQKWHDCWMYFI